jgi:uncharacterized protein with HEPN domain
MPFSRLLKLFMDRDLQSLLDMLQSAQIVMNYIAERTKNEFVTDLQFQDAVIRRLLVIGEASNRISKATQQALTTIPWIAINGMRNRLVHEYDELDLNVVWDTVMNSLPVLILELEKFVSIDKSQ